MNILEKFKEQSKEINVSILRAPTVIRHDDVDWVIKSNERYNRSTPYS